MPAFNAEVAHSLGQVEATNRLKDFVEQTMQRYQDQLSAADGTWNGNVLGFSLSTSGVTVKGTLTVEEDKVRVDGHLPLLALPFRGTIQKSITAELTQALA
jgi:hypothetical protein